MSTAAILRDRTHNALSRYREFEGAQSRHAAVDQHATHEAAVAELDFAISTLQGALGREPSLDVLLIAAQSARESAKFVAERLRRYITHMDDDARGAMGHADASILLCMNLADAIHRIISRLSVRPGASAVRGFAGFAAFRRR